MSFGFTRDIGHRSFRSCLGPAKEAHPSRILAASLRLVDGVTLRAVPKPGSCVVVVLEGVAFFAKPSEDESPPGTPCG